MIQKQYLFFVEETNVYLTNGTGGPLTVEDDSPRLEQAVFIITRVKDEEVNKTPVQIKYRYSHNSSSLICRLLNFLWTMVCVLAVYQVNLVAVQLIFVELL